MSNDRKPRDGSVSTRILAYLVGRANEIVLAEEITNATGLTKGQVQKAFNGFLSKDSRIRVIISGNAWSYDPNQNLVPQATAETLAAAADHAKAATPARMYEEVGLTRDERIIVRDENGTLFVLADL